MAEKIWYYTILNGTSLYCYIVFIKREKKKKSNAIGFKIILRVAIFHQKNNKKKKIRNILWTTIFLKLEWTGKEIRYENY